jgi:hypothetical protein
MMHNNNRNVKINQIETKVTKKKKTHSNKKETGKIHETKITVSIKKPNEISMPFKRDMLTMTSTQP